MESSQSQEPEQHDDYERAQETNNPENGTAIGLPRTKAVSRAKPGGGFVAGAIGHGRTRGGLESHSNGARRTLKQALPR